MQWPALNIGYMGKREYNSYYLPRLYLAPMPNSQPDTLQSAYNQLDAIRANDEAALKKLYDENFYKVETYILENKGSRQQAKDIFQEAFIATWRNVQLGKFVPQSATSLNGYLYQIAKNKWLTFLSSSHSMKVIPLKESMDFEEEEKTADKEAYIAEVKKHFKNLGSNCRDLLSRFYYLNESLREIAAAFDWTEATARNNKYRCIQKLKSLLKTK